MSGADLARTVAANWPELPIVVITGYADTTGLGDQLDDTVLLHKPFGINELGSAIERAVQRNDAAIRRAKVVPLRPRATG
jgi:FixJ family two-component response regulator